MFPRAIVLPFFCLPPPTGERRFPARPRVPLGRVFSLPLGLPEQEPRRIDAERVCQPTHGRLPGHLAMPGLQSRDRHNGDPRGGGEIFLSPDLAPARFPQPACERVHGAPPFVSTMISEGHVIDTNLSSNYH